MAEPVAKNTAPAIAVATKYIKSKAKEDDPIILVVPSDPLIKNLGAFKTTVMRGEKLAKEGYIVTFGVKPTYPETGYGYVNITDEQLEGGFKVKQFVENQTQKLQKIFRCWNLFLEQRYVHVQGFRIL